MRKIVFLFSLFFITFGCSNGNTAKSVVEDYLSSYQNLEYQVIVDMEEAVLAEDDLNDEQKEVYRNILMKQYEDLEYEIVSEEYIGDNAVVIVNINVYDLYSASVEASSYLSENSKEFYEDGVYSQELYLDYKLEVYKSVTNKVNYTIEFSLYKEDGIWQLGDTNSEILSKIHGIYVYE